MNWIHLKFLSNILVLTLLATFRENSNIIIGSAYREFEFLRAIVEYSGRLCTQYNFHYFVWRVCSVLYNLPDDLP